MTISYLHTMLRVTNLETTIQFFNLLGLEETNRIEDEAGKFTLVFLAAKGDMPQAAETKSPLLELTYNWPDENGNTEEIPNSSRNFGHLAYRVDNIYETCEHLQNNGVTINRPPRDGRMAFIKTPDDISIELLQKGEALPAQEPWINMNNEGTW